AGQEVRTRKAEAATYRAEPRGSDTQSGERPGGVGDSPRRRCYISASLEATSLPTRTSTSSMWRSWASRLRTFTTAFRSFLRSHHRRTLRMKRYMANLRTPSPRDALTKCEATPGCRGLGAPPSTRQPRPRVPTPSGVGYHTRLAEIGLRHPPSMGGYVR